MNRETQIAGPLSVPRDGGSREDELISVTPSTSSKIRLGFGRHFSIYALR